MERVNIYFIALKILNSAKGCEFESTFRTKEVHTSHGRIEVYGVAELHPGGSLPEEREIGLCVCRADVEGEGGKKGQVSGVAVICTEKFDVEGEVGKKGQASGVVVICMDGTPEKLGSRPCMKKDRLARGWTR